MALADGIRTAIRSLLGVSAYEPAKGFGPELDDETVERVREAIGGNLQPLPTTKLRWYLADLERAQHNADVGNIEMAARLYRAMRRDGVLAGLLGTRTAGLVRLPKRFYGKRKIVKALTAKNGTRSVFDEMFPPAELALLAADGITLGVGVAELVPVPGRSYPVMVRLDPEFLQYQWSESRWYFNSLAGRLPITPGDGRWILHVPGGRMSPWTFGLWPALGRSFINKEHALLHRSNFSAKLANPARLGYAPAGATEPQRMGWLKKIGAWATNTVFDIPPGWDVKILESNGRGFEVFEKEISTSDYEMMIALAGQIVTTTGGSGFVSAGLFKTVRQDLIKGDAEALAYTINTQGLPGWIATEFGEDAIDDGNVVEWDTDEPKDKASEATTMTALGAGIKSLNEALAAAGTGRSVDVTELASRFGVPLREGAVEPPEETSVAPPASGPRALPEAA